MSVYKVEVGVALGRPPRHDATVFIEVEAVNGNEAELLAQQIASCHPRVVMAVSSLVTDWEEGSA